MVNNRISAKDIDKIMGQMTKAKIEYDRTGYIGCYILYIKGTFRYLPGTYSYIDAARVFLRAIGAI